MTKLFAKISIAILVFFLLYQCAWLNLFVFNSTYSSFIEQVRILLNKDANWISFIQSKIPPARYELIKALMIVADILLLILFLFLIFNIRRVIYFTELVTKAAIGYINKELQHIKQMNKWSLLLFLFILLFTLVRSVWFAINQSIQYDEAWIYNYFINNSFIQSFLLPSNNHKMYTFFAWWFNLLPLDKTFLIRLPNILIGTIVIVFFFSFTQKIFTTNIALIGMAWFSSCLPIAKNMTMGKSYLLVLLFHLLLLRVYYSIYKKQSISKNAFYLITTIAVFGYFSNPVFIFGHIFTTFFFILTFSIKRKYILVNKSIYANLLALPVIFLLYATDIVSGSFSALVEFAITQKLNIESFFLLCLDNNAEFLTGFTDGRFIFLALLVFGIILFFRKGVNNKLLYVYAITSIIWLPFYAEIVKDDTSIHKTIYITVSFVLILLFICKNLLGKLLNKAWTIWVTGIVVTFVNLILLVNNGWFNWSFKKDDSVQQVSKILLQNNAGSCYLNQFYYKPGLEFNFKTQKKPLKIFMGVAGSIDYVENIPKNPMPDYLIIDKELMPQYIPPAGYIQAFDDQFVIVFKSEL